jgi:chromosome segregation ATPase
MRSMRRSMTPIPSVLRHGEENVGATQFLFISHNKIAMEMAEQLVGVTMQESGVSRVVEVDIQEALKMRDAA